MRISALASVISVLVLISVSTSVSEVAPGTNPTFGEDIPERVPAGGCRDGNDSSVENGSASSDPLNLSYEFVYLPYEVFYDGTKWKYPYVMALNLTWESPWGNDTVKEYQVFYGLCSCELQYLNSTPGNEPYYSSDYEIYRWDTGNALSNNDRIFVRVVALNNTGSSTSSAIVEIPNPYHGSPNIVDISAPTGEGYVALTWEAPNFENVEGPKEYRLYRAHDDDWYYMGIYLDTVDANTTYWVDQEPAFGEEVMYTVEAVYPDHVITSDYEYDVMASAWSDKTLKSTVKPGSVLLHWEEPFSGPRHTIDSFRIYKSDREIFHPDGMEFWAKIGPGNTSYNDTHIESESLHTYAVQVVYEEGETEFTSILMIYPMIGIPVMPEYFRHSVDDRKGTVRLEWEAAEVNQNHPVTAYRIYRSGGEGGEELLVEVEPGTRSYLDKDVKQKRNYGYRVTAVNDLGESESTDTRIIFVGKEEEPNNLANLGQYCFASLFIFAPVLIIFLSGYVVGGWREVKKYKSGQEKEKAKGDGEEGDPPGEDVPDTDKDEDKQKPPPLPKRPRSRDR